MIFKEIPKTEFTMIPNVAAQDTRLSMAARGMLTYLVSLPPTWVIHITELQGHFPDGLAAIRARMDELQKAGYVYKENAASSRNVKFHAANVPYSPEQWKTKLISAKIEHYK
jgi:hypothetical protein